MKKAILFCNLPYAFAILNPISKELQNRNIQVLWYVPKELEQLFYIDEDHTSSISKLKEFRSDAIFVPGNEVPWYLRGVKVQIFHGLAGEKKGHFRIRDYFDLYLTQGPYFTNRFQKLSKKYKNFQVKETGWSKLDPLFCIDEKINTQKEDILKKSNAKIILLYAPTFSPSLTSAPALLEEFKKIADDKRFYTIVKSHDKMDTQIIDQYKILQNQNFVIDKSDDITPLLKLSDLMISDTSSVVYEFLLLNKPLITLNSNSEHIKWENIKTPVDLIPKIESYLKGDDPFKIQRDEIFKLYHPYRDGKSSKRVVDATLEYIRKFKVPKKRDIPLHRKIKLLRKFGFKPLFS